jgi:trimethylamine:corrinoid methyltransferase-like protein
MHTAMKFRKEHFFSKLFIKEGYEIWEKNGKKTVMENAADAYKKRLEDHKYVENSDKQNDQLSVYLKDYLQNISSSLEAVK